MRSDKAIPVLFATILCLFESSVTAQTKDSTALIIDELKQIQKAYTQSSSLSFNMQYRYANESKPFVILDSVSGKIEMQNGNCHYIMDSIETIKNGRYSIILFKENNMMYLSKPVEADQGQNPLMMLDSALIKSPGMLYSVKQSTSIKQITLLFPKGMMYKKIDFFIDNKTGFLSKAIYLMKTQLLMDDQNENIDKKQYDEYARVELNITQYSTATIDPSVFDEQKYYTKQGKDFKTTESFKQYKIFIGSLNL